MNSDHNIQHSMVRSIPMRIEVRHLRYVVAASKCGSFRQAAKTLEIEQSAVSRRIRDLEDEIGAALFIRHSGGVILTHAGKKFVRHAQQALSEISHAAVGIGLIGRGERGAIRMGIFSSLASGFLARLLHTYCSRYGDVRIDIVEGAPSDHISAVRLHNLDVAFVTGVPMLSDCDASQFWTERVFVVLPRAHDLAKRASLRWRDLYGEAFVVSESDPGPEIQDFLVKHLADLGVQPSIERHRVGRDNLMQIVSFGRGLTLTSESTIAAQFPGVVYRPLDGETLPFCAVWSPRNDNPAFRRMLSLAKAMAHQNGIGRSKQTETELMHVMSAKDPSS
ncbi:LysR family transcriptional regulator [Pararhizobium sp. IMCC21322]|uniref:LysR family transcriptional regulator n=1 Tax=Pararhizobium sp. IMCC21322 TaxID=3067903 RepID=UPI00274240C6|nr:LysR family transcriptional regulator [Pararhizobium sp. IMCC21322]